MKPFIPHLHKARRRPPEQMPLALLCCESTIQHIAASAGEIVVLRMDLPCIEGVSNCLQCGASVIGFIGLHVYCDLMDSTVNYGEVDEAPLTKEEYERICLAYHNTATAAHRGSN